MLSCTPYKFTCSASFRMPSCYLPSNVALHAVRSSRLITLVSGETYYKKSTIRNLVIERAKLRCYPMRPTGNDMHITIKEQRVSL